MNYIEFVFGIRHIRTHKVFFFEPHYRYKQTHDRASQRGKNTHSSLLIPLQTGRFYGETQGIASLHGNTRHLILVTCYSLLIHHYKGVAPTELMFCCLFYYYKDSAPTELISSIKNSLHLALSPRH